MPPPLPPPSPRGGGRGNAKWVALAVFIAAAASLAVVLAVVSGRRSIGVYEGADTPEAAYEQLFDVWASGDLVAAKAGLRDAIRRWPTDQRLVFFYAACLRSDFGQVRQVRPWFLRVVDLGADTPEGRCAELMVRIDFSAAPDVHFQALATLLDEVPEDPILLWMGGVAGRATRQNHRGAGFYERMLARIEQGPGIVHHTYANLLDDLRRYDESLVQRRKAVELRPRGFTYQGLVNTLSSLGRVEEALEYCPIMIELAPRDPAYWSTWGGCLFRVGDIESGREKYIKAIELDPRDPEPYSYFASRLRDAGLGREAMAYYRQAADLGYTSAMNELGRMFVWGVGGVEIEPMRGLEIFREAAGKGDRHSMYNLGEMYRLGNGVDVDFELAANWYRRSADHGYPGAKMRLGHAYRTGEGVPRDETESFRYYLEAAEGGHSHAMIWVGFSYEEGLGVEPDLRQAQRWFEAAAASGEVDGGMRLLNLHFFELPTDLETAAEVTRWSDWIEERADAAALNQLAWLFATASNEDFCDGSRAVRAAAKACELEPDNPMYLDTLAAAHARNGDFELAVATQQRAIDRAEETGHADWVSEYQPRLRLYLDGRPYVQR